MDPELSEADIKALSAISQSVTELGARTAAIEGFIQNQVAINERTTANLERIFEALEKLQEGRMPELRFRFRIPPEEVDKVKSEVVKSESSPVVESEVIKADSPLPLVETSQLPRRAPPRDLKEPGPFSVSDVLRLGDVLGSEVHSGANSSLIPLIMVEDMFMRPSAKPPDVLTDDYFGLNVMGIVLRFKNLFGEVAEVQNRTVKELRKKKIVCKMSPSMSLKEMIWKLVDPANILELLDALESDVTKPDLEKFRGTVLMSQATLQFIQCIDLPSDYSIPEEIKSKGFEMDTEELGSIVEGHDHDGLGRVASILLVVFITITSNYRQSLQFKDLDREKKKITAQVIRDGGRQEISIYNMLVDDTLEMLKIGKLIAKAEKVDINEGRMSAGSIKRYMMVRATRGVREGGWYFEIQMVHLGESGHTRRGWSTERRLGEAMNIGVGRAAAAAASADVPVPNEDESIFHQADSVEEVENEDGLIDNQTASVGDSEELVLIGLNPTNTSLELLALSCVNQERLALGVSDTVEDDEISCIAAKCIVPKKLGIKSRPVSDQGMEALAKGCSNSVNVKVKKCRAVTHESVDCLITSRESIVVNLHTGDLGPQDPFAIDGVAFKKTFAYARFEQQPKRFGDPKILLPNIELELKLERENAEIRLSDPSQYQSIIDASGMFVRMLSQSSARMIQVRDFKMRIFICKVVWHWRVQTCGSVCSCLLLRSELLAEFPSSIHGRNQIALFSLPRPPEDVNLEDKIKLKEGGMMRIGNIRAQL